ncbi:MAG: FkbM family methyltransferase [Chthoniobacter sp.]|uniref:FkbM family methyltransferase n=1 Tax=Chthoniobacter sp. TaxID=2510640 RepID=UPI0032A25560
MKNVTIKPDSWLRRVLPLTQKTRAWAWKYFDRVALRLVISGGRVRFLDTDLNFPEGVGVTYSTPLYWQGAEAYEAPTSRALAALLSRAKLFLDVGSNVGIYAVYAGVKHPEVMTFAFEPVPVIWAKNVQFHRANHLPEKNVLKLALSAEEKVEQFFLPIYTTGIEEEQTGTLNAQSWQTREPTIEKIDVQCTTLDRFAASNALPAGFCCLKIDVENHEAAVLRGGQEFIRTRRPWIVCEILYGQKVHPTTGERMNDNREILEMIEELAYVPLAVTSEGFFRTSLADFDRSRTFKDFLLLPTEAMPANASYLALDSVKELLPKE